MIEGAAPGRSPKKMRAVIDRRLPDVESIVKHVEDFVIAALIRSSFRFPFRSMRSSSTDRRRIDLCYPDDWLALEAKGFQWYRMRSVWDRDALRGNELQLAQFRVLTFTSAFTDWDVACQVAHALGLPMPAPQRPLSFAEWSRNR